MMTFLVLDYNFTAQNCEALFNQGVLLSAVYLIGEEETFCAMLSMYLFAYYWEGESDQHTLPRQSLHLSQHHNKGCTQTLPCHHLWLALNIWS